MKSKALDKCIRKIKLRQRKNRKKYYYTKRIKQLLRKNRGKSERREYSWLFQEEGRHYKEYNKLFSIGLGCSIVDALVALGRKRLTIVDDGAGKGYFLAELKPKLKEKGIESRTIALSISRRIRLWIKKRQGIIDEVFFRSAENFVPEKKVDAIFSFLGSISHVEDLVRKEYLLNFAHSLRRGGIMAVGFHVEKVGDPNQSGQIVGGLSRNPNFYRVLPLEMEMKGIEKAFKKRGFEARFVQSNLLASKQYPNWMLIVKRVK